VLVKNKGTTYYSSDDEKPRKRTRYDYTAFGGKLDSVLSAKNDHVSIASNNDYLYIKLSK
jgi:hypothetical protein